MGRDAATGLSTEQILANIRALRPELVERAREFDDLCRIPSDVMERMKEAGVLTMLVPRSHGGSQLNTRESAIVLEALAAIDGSLSWTVDIGSETPQLLGLLAPEAFDEFYAAESLPLVGGSVVPNGKARKVDGGYRVSGRWGFASGCQNWTHIFATCIVDDDEGGEAPKKGPPLIRGMIMRVDQVTIEETWRPLGMRGTGSHHYNCEDVFVPEQRIFDLSRGRGQVQGIAARPFAEWGVHAGAVILGIAQGALNDFLKVAHTKKRRAASDVAAKDPVIQHQIGIAEASLRAARAYLHSEADWCSALTGEEDVEAVMGRIPLSLAWLGKRCVEVVDLVWSLNGSSSAFDGWIFERRLRDIKLLSQHGAFEESVFMRTGARLFEDAAAAPPAGPAPS